MVIPHTKKVNVGFRLHLNLRKVLDQYFVKYISATAALYFKVLLFWNDNV